MGKPKFDQNNFVVVVLDFKKIKINKASVGSSHKMRVSGSIQET